MAKCGAYRSLHILVTMNTSFGPMEPIEVTAASSGRGKSSCPFVGTIYKGLTPEFEIVGMVSGSHREFGALCCCKW